MRPPRVFEFETPARDPLHGPLRVYGPWLRTFAIAAVAFVDGVIVV